MTGRPEQAREPGKEFSLPIVVKVLGKVKRQKTQDGKRLPGGMTVYRKYPARRFFESRVRRKSQKTLDDTEMAVLDWRKV